MNSGDWLRVKEIYLRARTLTALDEREAYLDEACGEDTPGRAQVNALLSADTTPLRSFESLPGQTIGRYQVLEEIGRGTGATVYRARDLHLPRFVALKVLPTPLLADPQAIQRFRQEAACL